MSFRQFRVAAAALLGLIMTSACGFHPEQALEGAFKIQYQVFSTAARTMINVLEGVGEDLGPEFERRWKEVVDDGGFVPFFLQVPLETTLDVLVETLHALDPLTGAVSAQWSGEIHGDGILLQEPRYLRAFQEIRIAGPGQVILTQGGAPGLTIEAERNLLPYIRSDVEAGVLTLGFKEPGPSIHPAKPIRFHLNVGDISTIHIFGSADVITDGLEASELEITIVGSGDMHSDAISAEKLYIHVVGAGDIEIESLAARLVQAKITGAGDVRLAGGAASLQVAILGSGDYVAPELCAPKAKVLVLGSGDAHICALDALQISVPGSGDVFYSGSPSMDVLDIGAGDIRREQ